ncbi:MaoC/PaaZ C-terminal domain-containing protein [Rhodococcus sp. DMU1]|uniref:MaoC/PaaZ C-terminal domain-containing protein n=1 Tax=Rhodococcus sp. DMU1 TaxID=2722825 RepID=UPI00143E5DBA|nr:MaoC/PaaZ C-terminal domain-containing protein [Rhodococcus sp. DMU1]QIX53877.1 dehydratase [Rhodococcus sp. DMU1]
MGKYYEDFEIGQDFSAPGRTIDHYDVAAFAGLSGDFNPVHTNREFAASTSFGQPIAHGVLGLSVATGLLARTGMFDGTAIAFLGIDGWRFSKPIFFGDTIHVEFTITAMRETKDPGAGILTRAVRIVNQRGETVQSGDMTLMLRRRPAA